MNKQKNRNIWWTILLIIILSIFTYSSEVILSTLIGVAAFAVATIWYAVGYKLRIQNWIGWALFACSFLLMYWVPVLGSILRFPPELIGIPCFGLIILGIWMTLSNIEERKVFRHQIRETPKTFLKKCVKCGREIPMSSEECPSCGSKQPQ